MMIVPQNVGAKANCSRRGLIGLACALLVCLVPGAHGRLARADSPSLILSIAHEIGHPGQQIPTSIILQNLTDEVFAFQLSMHVDRADLIGFPGLLTVKTCLECADDACTSTVEVPCTSFVAPLITANTLIENWSYVEARVFADTQIRVTAISDLLGTGNVPPIPPNTTGTLVKLIAEAQCNVPDTLTERTALYSFDSSLTRFSNVVAELIDSTQLGSGGTTVSFNMCGDMNGDGIRDGVDLNLLIAALFFNGSQGCPGRVSDLTCDGVIDASDLNALILLLFFNGPDCPC